MVSLDEICLLIFALNEYLIYIYRKYFVSPLNVDIITSKLHKAAILMRRTAISDTGEHNKVPGTLDMSPKIKYSKKY